MASAQNERELSFTPYQPAAEEEYMNDAQLAHFRKILLDWKEQLISEAESTKSYIQDESTAMPDINDRATQEEEFALALRTRDRERKLIRKIDKSIAEISASISSVAKVSGNFLPVLGTSINSSGVSFR